jgi:signal transduction histidine kinase
VIVASDSGTPPSRLWPNWLRGGWGVAALAAGLYTALYTLWTFTGWGNDLVLRAIEAFNSAGGPQILADARALASDLAYLPMTLLGALACFRIGRHPHADPLTRRAWAFLGLACLANFIGDLLWFHYEIILQANPFPSWADAAYLAFYPLAMIGLLSFPYSPASRADQQRLYLDSAIVVVGSWMVIWYFVLGPSVESFSLTVESALAAAYPLADLPIVYGLMVYLFRHPKAARQSGFEFLLGGMLFFVVADILYGIQGLNGTYVSGGWLDILWLVAYVLFVFAALEQFSNLQSQGERFAVARPLRYLWLAPYIVLIMSYALVVWAFAGSTEINAAIRGLLGGALALTALTSLRQVLDLQENRRLSAEALTRLRQLEEAGAALNRAQHLASLGTLAAGVAHEINNPLSAIIASAHALKRRVLAGQWDKEAHLVGLGRIERSAWHGTKIAQSLVTYAHGIELSLARTTAHRLITGAMDLARLPPDAEVEVRVHIAPDAPEIICDPDQIAQVLANLLTNARDAITPPGLIELAAAGGPHGGLILTVSDTGMGMSPETLARAFDPFYTTKPVGEGTGLGLSICRGIAQAHDGHIEIESHIGKGTRVTITLPPEPRPAPVPAPPI